MDDVTLAYLAGAMDADGFISMSRRILRGSTTYSEFIGLAQLSPTVPQMLQDRFGGYIQYRTRTEERAKNWRPIYYWAATTKNAAAAVRELRPYLLVKTEQADLVLALRDSKSLPAKVRGMVREGTRNFILTPEVQEHRALLYARIKELNRNGVS